VAIYGIDPERIEKMPQRVLGWLIRQMGAIEAEQTLRMALAVQTPHMKRYERERLIRQLQRAMGAQKPVKPEPPEIVEHDPEKAAEWFRAQGILVERVH